MAAASSSSILSKSSPSGAVPRPSSVTRTFVRPSLRVLRGGSVAPLMSETFPERPKSALFFWLGAKTQGIAFRRPRFGGARGLGLGDVLREHRHDADALAMGGHHHGERLGFIETKHRLEDSDHEVARRIVVVEENHFVQARTLNARLGLRRNLGGGLAHRALLGAPCHGSDDILHLGAAGFKPVARLGGRAAISNSTEKREFRGVGDISPTFAAMVEERPSGGARGREHHGHLWSHWIV